MKLINDVELYYYNRFEGNDNKIHTSSKNSGTIKFIDFLNCSNKKWRDTILKLRQTEYHSKQYEELKNTLPLVWIGGKSETGFRRKNDVTEIHNLISIDIDRENNEELFDTYSIDIIKEDLVRQQPCFFYAGKSCGGYGIVVYMLTKNLTIENEKYVFNYLYEKFKQAGITIDSQTKDLVTRARLISYDENPAVSTEIVPFDCDKVSVDDIDIITHSSHTKTFACECYTDGENNNKLCIDKTIQIKIKDEIISGNEVRWRISLIAQNYFGENAKEWCDKHFYCKEGSIYSKVNSNASPNSFVLNWLIKNKYIKNSNDNGILINEGEYLSSKIEIVKNFIDKHDRSIIIAPTGTGKTTLINGVNGLADLYDAVVIVPYNNTNALYDRCQEISSKQKAEFKIKDGKTIGKYVMVIDQAVTHWHEIKNKNIIIDECHVLFSERVFRNKIIQLVNKLNNDFNGKLTLITATPTGEADLLNIYNKLNFYTIRENIDVLFKKVRTVLSNDKIVESKKSAVLPICNTIKSHYNKDIFDRIILMDDMSAKDVYDALVLKYDIDPNDILYYRADRKEYKECEQLINEEKLMKKITICTRIAFNGLNFKNENENVLVITSFTPGSLLAANIIQMVGRVRKSKVTCLCYYNDAEFKTTVEDVADKLIIKHEQQKYPLPEQLYHVDERYDDEEWIEIVNKIDRYMLDNSADVNMLINNLVKCNYIKCKIYDEVIDMFKTTNYRKRLENKIMKDYISKNKDWADLIIEEDWTEYEYLDILVNKYNMLITRYDKAIVNNIIAEKLKRTNSSFENILKQLKLIGAICSMTEKEYAETIQNYTMIIASVKHKIDKIYTEKLNNKLQYIMKLRNQYSMRYNDVNNMLKEYMLDEEFKNVTISEQNSKKTLKKCVITDKMKPSARLKYNLSIGQEFESAQALCDYVKKSNTSISMWRSKGWIE